eukprot:m.204005 g.204005  ORF g.204005 m.204005 type:complete len:646 (-) comp32873_c0_seq1:16-1953(-)
MGNSNKSKPVVNKQNTNSKTQIQVSKGDLGRTVQVKGHKGAIGTLQYFGASVSSKNRTANFCGVSFTGPIGDIDGEYKSCRYFQCPPKFGVFVNSSKVTVIEDHHLGDKKEVKITAQDAAEDPIEGFSSQIPDGLILKHEKGHEWGHTGYGWGWAQKYTDFCLSTSVKDLFDYCPFSKDNVKGIKPDDVRSGEILGKGNFGEVYSGKVKLKQSKVDDFMLAPDADGCVNCAIKRCISDLESEVIGFASEAVIHNQFSHGHIVRLYGVTGGEKLGGGPMEIILEYCEGGDLLGVLQKGKMEWNDIRRALVDIADGCTYLSAIGFIHRDLAARNIFLRAGKAKVGDFGLSKMIQMSASVKGVGEDSVQVPLRWTAPEALFYRNWSVQSDVWSFGIIMYECYTAGLSPYFGLRNNEVIGLLVDKKVLPPPRGCPPEVYALMLQCWIHDPKNRITFTQLLTKLVRVMAKVKHTLPDPLTKEELTKIVMNQNPIAGAQNEYVMELYQGPDDAYGHVLSKEMPGATRTSSPSDSVYEYTPMDELQFNVTVYQNDANNGEIELRVNGGKKHTNDKNEIQYFDADELPNAQPTESYVDMATNGDPTLKPRPTLSHLSADSFNDGAYVNMSFAAANTPSYVNTDSLNLSQYRGP